MLNVLKGRTGWLLPVAALGVALTGLAAASVESSAPDGLWRAASVSNIQRQPAQVARGSTVLGIDDRQRVLDTTVWPFSAVVYLELYDAYGFRLGTCSGMIVGPDTVLTAAHCLYSFGEWTGGVVVVPGKNGLFEPFGFYWAENFWVPQGWIDAEVPAWDLGLIQLPNSDVTSLTRWMRFASHFDQTLERPDWYPATAGYPGDKPDGTMWFATSQSFAAVDDLFLYFDIDIYPGQSGSAVFSLNPDEYFFGYIAGMVTYGLPDINVANRITEATVDDLWEICAEAGCEIDGWKELGATPTETPTATPTPTRTPTAVPSPTPSATPSIDVPSSTRRTFVPGLTRNP